MSQKSLSMVKYGRLHWGIVAKMRIVKAEEEEGEVADLLSKLETRVYLYTRVTPNYIWLLIDG